MESFDNLRQRWPDDPLLFDCRRLHYILRRLTREISQTDTDEAPNVTAFRIVCGWIAEALDLAPPSCGSKLEVGSRRDELSVHRTVDSIAAREDRHQRLASLLAMLLHHDVDAAAPEKLVNPRRPQTIFSTHPNSTAAVKLSARLVLDDLLTEPLPVSCSTPAAASRWAERSLDFTIVDPSMETGQLLLGVAEELISRIHRRWPPKSAEAQRLLGAALERLGSHVLRGIDRHPLAEETVRLAFRWLGFRHGVPGLRLAHLETADSLQAFLDGRLGEFDAVLNNPPWGESLTLEERQRLREGFSTSYIRVDTYIPFCELALRSLRRDGRLVLLLPSQILTVSNASRLRQLFTEMLTLDRLVVLPRAAFGAATVRGLLLAGRRRIAKQEATCRVTVFPLGCKVYSNEPARRAELRVSDLRALGKASWWPMIQTDSGAAETRLRLSDVAEVALGAQLYGTGKGRPRQTRETVRQRPFSFDRPAPDLLPAVRGRDVQPFRLVEPSCFIRYGPWLSRPGRHRELRRKQRLFVREICRRDGRLTAAMATDGYIPLHGVLTLVPRSIELSHLLGLLVSEATAEYVRHHTASFLKVDFQKITVGEMREVPVPVTLVAPAAREKLGLGARSDVEKDLCCRLDRTVAGLRQSTGSSSAEAPANELDEIVAALFALPQPSGIET